MRDVDHELALRYRDAIVGRLYVEGLTCLSDEEIERCLSGCVGGNWLIVAAKILRDNGDIELWDLGL